jgi:Flp pilus assembly protein TadG
MLNFLMLVKKNLKRDGFLRQDTGAAAVEFAFILPFMLILYFGLIDVTGLISVNRRIVSAATTMADLVGQQKTNVLASTITDQFNAVYVTMNPMPSSNVRVEIFDYRYVGTTITLIWKMNNNQGPSCGVVPDTTTMAPLMTAANDLIIARACTTYSPAVANFIGTSIMGATTFNVRQAISVRPRASPGTLNCYTAAGSTTLCS